jgi:hypothetical protein
MGNLDYVRRQIQAAHKQLASESKKDSDASASAARAREQAAKTSSPATMKSRLREAERQEKAALDARKKRAALDKKIADLTRKLHDEEAKVAREQSRAFSDLQADIERRSRAAEDHTVRRLIREVEPSHETAEFDFFISHASPDKEEIARPLKEALEARRCTVWMDEAQIQIGDSLRRKIDEGLRRSRFGIVILSRSFLKGREWTERELSGLFVREEEAGEPRILPIWHDVTKAEVAGYSPVLADKAALKSADYTVDEMADLLGKRLGHPDE